jgi:polyhydroxyalkanoate synthesis regulator phasin
MTINNNDRTYWRLCDDKRLIEEAYNSNDELCIVLGDRLECVIDIVDEAIALREQRDELRRTVERLRRELDELEQAGE